MIPDEAVEAAARALYELQVGQAWGDKPEWAAVYEGYATAALEAAAPHLMASAWDEGATAGLGWDENRGEDFNVPNPYRKP